MEEIIKQKLEQLDTTLQKKNFLRQYFQALILKILFEKKHFEHLAFVGGTALRFIHGTKRFSEDIDFSAVKGKVDFASVIRDIKKGLNEYNIEVAVKNKVTGNVVSSLVKFPGFLYKYGISQHKNELLSIKIEVDQDPPRGADLTLHLVNSDFVFYVQSYDLPSLMAGKLHALLFRKYAKGRDYFDLVWYLSSKISPNITMLKNAIYQTQNKIIEDLASKWTAMLIEKLKHADFDAIKRDVLPFLEKEEDALLLNKENLVEILRGYGKK